MFFTTAMLKDFYLWAKNKENSEVFRAIDSILDQCLKDVDNGDDGIVTAAMLRSAIGKK